MPLSKADKKRGFQFIEAPPVRSMRKRTPESAPRLFEWLTDNGFVEPIKTTGGGRLGAGQKKKKRSPI
jgi:hypothetical protein